MYGIPHTLTNQFRFIFIRWGRKLLEPVEQHVRSSNKLFHHCKLALRRFVPIASSFNLHGCARRGCCAVSQFGEWISRVLARCNEVLNGQDSQATRRTMYIAISL